LFSLQRSAARRWLPLVLLLLAGCGDAPAAGDTAAAAPADSAVVVADDAGRELRLARPASRVVSLVPSATETLLALGAREQIVGRTRYDTAPEVRDVPSVGGGLDPSIETLIGLRPELVIVWEGERSRGLRPRLEEMGIGVFALAADDTTDVFRSIDQLGRLTGRGRAADSLATAIRAELAEVRASVAGRTIPSVFYVVSNDPPMTAGPRTFLGQLIGIAGGQSIFPDAAQDWPTVAMEEIVRRQPEVVILPLGEIPTQTPEALRTRPGWRELRAVREGRVATVDADLVNRPGPNLGRAARALRDALHPELAGR
jgi:iron complex transport system substrate-binding protein